MPDQTLTFDQIDSDGAVQEALDAVSTRASFLGKASIASAALLAAIVAPPDAEAVSPSDAAILNFALTLEYLQAAFYTEAERMKAIKGDVRKAARKLGSVERAHVKAFQDVLGRNAIGRPTFDFQGVTEKPRPFLKTAVAFEDLAVAAYGGQAANLKAASAVAAAVSIYSVEARHAAWMRYLFGLNPAAKAFDQPKTKSQITQIVRSTNFIAAPPKTKRKRAPSFTG